uniref:Uncharacterized protein n=1 Tax=Paramormyrops kingsleyae TaxID=1676925 RepID=A0A3B3R6F0_9TELE
MKFGRGHIVGLHEAWWSYRAIVQHVGHTDVTVTRCWNQWAGEGTHTRREGSGHPRQTRPREDRCIVSAGQLAVEGGVPHPTDMGPAVCPYCQLCCPFDLMI